MLAPLSADDPREIGPYRLQGRIGSGGMGTVYLGFGADSKAVAVKVASPLLADDDEFRERFGREVTAAQRVRGKAIANVIDADTGAASPWMATEYVDGVSLADAVRRRGRLDPSLVRGFAVGLLDALVAIHAAGIVHRDLKPSNILLSWDGPKVIDFGIAHLVDAVGLTRTGHVIGTLAWMAPEQMRGDPSAAASDVFAWGTCVTFAATGRHPFHAERQEVLAYRVQAEEPQLGDLPGYLVGLVSRALAKDVVRRPAAADLMTELVGRGVDAEAAADDLIEKTWIGSTPARAIVTSSPSDGAGREVPWYSAGSGFGSGPGVGAGGPGSPAGSVPPPAARAPSGGSWWASPGPGGTAPPGHSAAAGPGPTRPVGSPPAQAPYASPAPAGTGWSAPPGGAPPGWSAQPGQPPPNQAVPPNRGPLNQGPLHQATPPGGGSWRAPGPVPGGPAGPVGSSGPPAGSWGARPGPGAGPGAGRPGYGPRAGTPLCNLAVVAVVLGGLSALFGWTKVPVLLAIGAIVVGSAARRRIVRYTAAGRPERGSGLAAVGIGLGVIGIIETIFAVASSL
jgi:eukaryotic-like serine/threonine-protein kinase